MQFDSILIHLFLILGAMTIDAANQSKHARDFRHLQKALYGNAPQKTPLPKKPSVKNSTAKNRVHRLMGHLLTSSNHQKKL